MRKRITSILVCMLLTLSLTLSSCQFPFSASKDSHQTARDEETLPAFDAFLNEEFQNAFSDSLLTLHYTLKNPAQYGIEKPQQAFPSITEHYNDDCKAELQKTKKNLSTIHPSSLPKDQQILYETVEKYVDQQLTLCDYPQFLHLLGANSGLSSNLPLTLAEYTFYYQEDVTDYLSILTQIPTLFEEAFAWEEKQADAGYSLCDFELADTIAQIDRFLDDSQTNLLIETFNQRVEALSSLSEDQLTSYKKNNEHLVNTIVIPAFQKLKNNLSRLQKNAPAGQGLSTYEDGAFYYEKLIQAKTMSDRSMNTLIKTLEKRMKDITARIETVTKESPKAYAIYLSTESYTEDTPEEMLSYLEKAMQQDYPALSSVSYKAEPIPSALKNNTTAAYYMVPPLDSTEENRIYYGNAALGSASLFMTLAHEGYPGHLYQQNYLLEQGLSPIFYVLSITGYKEAWAFLVANDAADYFTYGSYDREYHDALTELYRCNDEFSYCISSLIDLYVNYKGYTQEQIATVLTSYGLDSTGDKAFYQYAVEEPGAYLQYYVGYLELLNIRQKTEKQMGDSFNKKAFHTLLLSYGPCYFSTLEKCMLSL